MTAKPIAIYYTSHKLNHQVTSVASARWLINQDCDPIRADNIKTLVKRGKLPETTIFMDREALDLRHPATWVKAYTEIKSLPFLELYTLSNFCDTK